MERLWKVWQPSKTAAEKFAAIINNGDCLAAGYKLIFCVFFFLPKCAHKKLIDGAQLFLLFRQNFFTDVVFVVCRLRLCNFKEGNWKETKVLMIRESTVFSRFSFRLFFSVALNSFPDKQRILKKQKQQQQRLQVERNIEFLFDIMFIFSLLVFVSTSIFTIGKHS